MAKPKSKNRIKYGNVDIDPNLLDPKHHKLKVTCWLDGDVIKVLKAHAAQIGIGYQTYLNQYLKEHLVGVEGLVSRIERIEKQLKIKAG